MIYFDNASTTLPKPPEVAQAIFEAVNSFGNPHRGTSKSSLIAAQQIYEARVSLAELFHVPNPLDIAFTHNATEALNAVIRTLFSTNDHIISTVLDHNSSIRPLHLSGSHVSFVGIDSNSCLRYEDFKNHLQPNTRAVVCSHGSNLTGQITDLHFLQDFCKKNNLLLILDTSQTAGFCEIDVQYYNIDFLIFTGHKSLFGPQGTGGICVNNSSIKIKPFKVGGSGSHTFSKEHPSSMPDAFEAGTLNAHGIAGLLAGVNFIKKTGLANIQKHETELTQYFYEKAKSIPNIKIYGRFSDSPRCPIVSLNLGDAASTDVASYLEENFQIATRAGFHCAPLAHEALCTHEQGAVRFSFSYFNTKDQIDVAINALKSL